MGCGNGGFAGGAVGGNVREQFRSGGDLSCNLCDSNMLQEYAKYFFSSTAPLTASYSLEKLGTEKGCNYTSESDQSQRTAPDLERSDIYCLRLGGN
jgi:hypothetical protein